MDLARFALRDKSVVLLTQGLGPQPFHGRVVILVNEWTNSAAEMLAGFASENHLATIVGTKTAGNVLGAVNSKVGAGYWLARAGLWLVHIRRQVPGGPGCYARSGG